MFLWFIIGLLDVLKLLRDGQTRYMQQRVSIIVRCWRHPFMGQSTIWDETPTLSTYVRCVLCFMFFPN